MPRAHDLAALRGAGCYLRQLMRPPRAQVGAIVTAVFGAIHTINEYQELGHLPGFSPFCQA